MKYEDEVSGYPNISKIKKVQEKFLEIGKDIIIADMRTMNYVRAASRYEQFLELHRQDLTIFGISYVNIAMASQYIYSENYSAAERCLALARDTFKCPDLFTIRALMILESSRDIHKASMLFFDAYHAFPEMTSTFKEVFLDSLELKTLQKYKLHPDKSETIWKHMCVRCRNKLINIDDVCTKCGYHKSKSAEFIADANKRLR